MPENATFAEMISEKQFMRQNVPFVESHLRGRSNFTISGIDVSLMASFEWSKRKLKGKLEGVKP